MGVAAVLFPPVGIGMPPLGRWRGHRRRSWTCERRDVAQRPEELGDTLDAGQAGLIVVYETNLADQVAASIKAANCIVSKATDMAADQLAADMKNAEAQQTTET